MLIGGLNQGRYARWSCRLRSGGRLVDRLRLDDHPTAGTEREIGASILLPPLCLCTMLGPFSAEVLTSFALVLGTTTELVLSLCVERDRYRTCGRRFLFATPRLTLSSSGREGQERRRAPSSSSGGRRTRSGGRGRKPAPRDQVP